MSYFSRLLEPRFLHLYYLICPVGCILAASCCLFSLSRFVVRGIRQKSKSLAESRLDCTADTMATIEPCAKWQRVAGTTTRLAQLIEKGVQGSEGWDWDDERVVERVDRETGQFDEKLTFLSRDTIISADLVTFIQFIPIYEANFTSVYMHLSCFLWGPG